MSDAYFLSLCDAENILISQGRNLRGQYGVSLFEAVPALSLGLGGAGSVLLFASYLPLAETIRPAFQVAAMGLLFAALAIALWRFLEQMRDQELVALISDLIALDDVPHFLCRRDSSVIARNAAAADAFVQRRLIDCLGSLIASPETVIARLHSDLAHMRLARFEAVTVEGTLSISMRRVGHGVFMWRIAHKSAALDGAHSMDGLPALQANSATGDVLSVSPGLHYILGEYPARLSDVFEDPQVQDGKLAAVKGQDGPVPVAVRRTEDGVGQALYQLIALAEKQALSVGQMEWDAIENLPVPLLRLGMQGEILGSNSAARKLLRCEIGPGTRLSDYLDGLGRPVQDWIAETRNTVARLQPQFLRGTGARRDLFVQVALCPAVLEAEPYTVAVLYDVTELKVLEAQFVQSQKMQAIGQLAGGVAHDFNNLLTAINGHCDLLLLRHEQGDPDHADLTQIHQNTNRAAALVGQLLAFSRKQDLQMEMIDLRDTLADLTHLLNRLVGERVQLVLRHYPERLFLMADKRQFEQVILNLVVNARDAMDHGGKITIETEQISLSVPMHRDRATVPAGDYAIVHVRDEGRGIAPEMLAHVFEPFYTTKKAGEGTGLGLSTVYGIVKQTGGFVFVESAAGEGTCFSLYFPARDTGEAEVGTSEGTMPNSSVPRGAGVVLLVEDEAPVRAFATRALKLRGYDVIEADCGEAALELLTDEALHVDLVVSDVVMPGVDGPTWVNEALKKRAGMKVVFMSGYSEEGMRDNRASIPQSVFLPKPFSLNDLLSTVQAQIG